MPIGQVLGHKAPKGTSRRACWGRLSSKMTLWHQTLCKNLRSKLDLLRNQLCFARRGCKKLNRFLCFVVISKFLNSWNFFKTPLTANSMQTVIFVLEWVLMLGL